MESRNFRGSLTLVLLLGAAPVALAFRAAESTPAQEHALVFETLKGKIRSVGEESFVVMVDGEAHTVQITEDTSYLLDGETARKDQVLKVDQEVKVEVEDGSATEVSTRSKA
jgi:hypothetical protein